VKKLTILLTALAFSTGAFAQVATAVKEDANAKAEVHKAIAHHHVQKMKEDTTSKPVSK
jgi:hypothetical protein